MQTTSVGPVGQKLLVHVIRAQGLQHMNHFTGDHPYVQAEIKHMGHHAKVTRAQTRPITQGDTLNPFWDERLELEPWTPGEALELTVYDKGLLGSKTEGKVMLPSQNFYPSGFNGMLPINLPHQQQHPQQQALLQVAVQVMGAPTTSSYAIPAATSYSTAQPTMYSTAQSTMYAQPASPVTYSQPTSMATQSLAAAPMYAQPAPTYSSAATYAAEPATAYASPQNYSSPQITYAAQPTQYSAPTQLANTYPPAQPAYSPASSVSVVQAPMTQSYPTAQPAYSAQPATYEQVNYAAPTYQTPQTFSAPQTFAAQPVTLGDAAMTFTGSQMGAQTFAPAQAAYTMPMAAPQTAYASAPAVPQTSMMQQQQTYMTEPAATQGGVIGATQEAFGSAAAGVGTAVGGVGTAVGGMATTVTGAATTGASAMTGTMMSKKRGKKPKVGQKKKGGCC